MHFSVLIVIPWLAWTSPPISAVWKILKKRVTDSFLDRWRAGDAVLMSFYILSEDLPLRAMTLSAKRDFIKFQFVHIYRCKLQKVLFS